MPLDDRCGLDDGQRGSPVDPELGEQDPEDPVTGPQLGPFDGLLVDGNLLSQGEVLGGQAEPGCQECSDQKIHRLDDAHGEVSPVNRPVLAMHIMQFMGVLCITWLCATIDRSGSQGATLTGSQTAVPLGQTAAPQPKSVDADMAEQVARYQVP